MQPVLKHEILCWIAVPEACDDAVVHSLCEEKSVLPLQRNCLNLYGVIFAGSKGGRLPFWGWQVGMEFQKLVLGQYGPG